LWFIAAIRVQALQKEPSMKNAVPRVDIPQIQCLCIGAANIDIRCALERPGIAGTSNPATINKMVGGAALNTARNVTLADMDCMFIGLVGDDEGGIQVADTLRKAGVVNGLLQLENRSTSHYISILEPDGSLYIAGNDMGIHDHLSPALIESLITTQVLENSANIFFDTNIPASTLEWLSTRFPDKPLYATTVSPAKAYRLANVLDRLDILFTNVAEAEALLGMAHLGAEELTKMLATTPVSRGTLSDGAKPLWYWENGKVERLDIPPHFDIKDVTGAGDALAGGFIAALHFDNDFGDAVQKGIDLAQKVLRVEGPYCG
jgi:sugar/nucleoside kinase (ribokinase family)